MELNEKLAARRKEIADQLMVAETAEREKQKARQLEEVATKIAREKWADAEYRKNFRTIDLGGPNDRLEISLESWTPFSFVQTFVFLSVAFLGVNLLMSSDARPFGIAILLGCAWYFVVKKREYFQKLLKDPMARAACNPTPRTHVRCPDCRELILAETRVREHCGCKLIPQSLFCLRTL